MQAAQIVCDLVDPVPNYLDVKFDAASLSLVLKGRYHFQPHTYYDPSTINCYRGKDVYFFDDPWFDYVVHASHRDPAKNSPKDWVRSKTLSSKISFDFGDRPEDLRLEAWVWTPPVIAPGWVDYPKPGQEGPVNVGGGGQELLLYLEYPEAYLVIDGVPDNQRHTRGGVVVKLFDNNNAHRRKITVKRSKTFASDAQLSLAWPQASVQLFSAETGGQPLSADGPLNRFSPKDLPKSFWVQGTKESGRVGDLEIALNVADKKRSDYVKFTVLWMDRPEPHFTGPISAGNAAKGWYTQITGTSELGIHRRVGNVRLNWGWAFEDVGQLHPTDFTNPEGRLFMDRNIQAGHYRAGKLVELTDWKTPYPPGNDTPVNAHVPNKKVTRDGKVYDLDFPGPGAFLDNPGCGLGKGQLARTRFNAKTYCAYKVQDNPDIYDRCSPEVQFNIRFTQVETEDKDPKCEHLQLYSSGPDAVPGDNQACVSTKAISTDERPAQGFPSCR
jgi:hypothetical protein